MILQMRTIKTSTWLCTLGALGFVGTAQALEPLSLGEGALKLTPTFKVSGTHDNNIRADQSKNSSWISRLEPRFKLDLDQGNAAHSLTLGVTREIVHSYSSENSSSWSLGLDSSAEIDVRNRVLLNAYLRETSAITAAADPSDEFRNRGASVGYGFGARGALINADASAGIDQVRTRNNANREKERDTSTLSGTLYWAVGPGTQVLGEVRRRNTGYETAKDLDNTSMFYLLGARWEATAFTSGSVRVGRQVKNFDAAGVADATSSVWELGVNWAPLTYSTVGLRTSRSLEEGEDGSRSIRTSNYGVDWNHSWDPRLNSVLSFGETRGTHNTGREDKTRTYSGSLTYNVMRQLDVGARYTRTDKQSTLASKAFDRNQFMLFVEAGL
jgi:hypothetical protein